MPSVAVILSNYNQGQYVRESLDAICRQTRPADEIVIIDDGSTDDSVAVIGNFVRRYPTVRLLRNEQNLGLQESIARVLPLVRSDYLAWAASDDRLLPTFLEKSMAALERHSRAGLCFSEVSVLRDETERIERLATDPDVSHIFDLSDLPEYMAPAEIVDRMHRAYLPISSNSVVVRRDALLSIGGYPKELEWHSDSFAYTVIALRHGACVVPDTLALIRARSGSYSQRGMGDPVRQRVVLNAMLDLLARQEYRDVRRVFRQCPSNFSPFGRLILELQARRLRDWELFVPYFIWKVKDYKRSQRLNWFATFTELSARAVGKALQQLAACQPSSLSRSALAETRSTPLEQVGELQRSAAGASIRHAPLDAFTLLVPTYNRPDALARLLTCLARQSVRFPILVLDSGSEQSKAANVALVDKLDLNVRLIPYKSSVRPFEKFSLGVQEVKTDFCALCADDDVIVVSSLWPLVEFLRRHVDFSAAHGWYFTFYEKIHMGITSIVYSGLAIDGADPLLRLRGLLNRYEAVTYAVYRTDILRWVLHEVERVTSMLASELLGGALTALAGKIARLPILYYGRSLGPSVAYESWHPIDFLISSPTELFADYGKCREILLEWFEKNPNEASSTADLGKLLDLFHLKYFSEYISPQIMNYLIDQVMAGRDRRVIMEGYWPLLADAARWGNRFGPWRGYLRTVRDLVVPGLRLRDVSRALGVVRDRTMVSATVSGQRREYRLYGDFLAAAKGLAGGQAVAIESAIAALNAYE